MPFYALLHRRSFHITYERPKKGENGEELEEDLEGDFLMGRRQHVILARYDSDYDEPISFLILERFMFKHEANEQR